MAAEAEATREAKAKVCYAVLCPKCVGGWVGGLY